MSDVWNNRFAPICICDWTALCVFSTVSRGGFLPDDLLVYFYLFIFKSSCSIHRRSHAVFWQKKEGESQLPVGALWTCCAVLCTASPWKHLSQRIWNVCCGASEMWGTGSILLVWNFKALTLILSPCFCEVHKVLTAKFPSLLFFFISFI